jgi:hypothetical protein
MVFYLSVYQGKKGMILAHSHICTRMVHRSALPYQNITGLYLFAAIYFNTKPLAV